METRANYITIGAFVVVVLAAALGALWWLYKSSESGATQVVRIVFPEAVTGLSTGGSVLFNGIRVGEVSSLEFPPEGGDDVIALTRINPAAPIKTDTLAKLGFQGLTGVAYISLTGGTLQAQSLFASVDDGDIPTMRAETSAFTNVLDSAQSVLAQINQTLSDVNGFLADNRGRLNQVVQNVDEMTGTLNAAAPQISTLIDDVASAGREVAAAAPQVTRVVEQASRLIAAIEPERVTTIVDNVGQFTDELPGIGAEASRIAQNVNGLVGRLDEAAGTIGEAVTAVAGVADAIDRDAVGAIVTNMRDATSVIASRATEIGQTIDDSAAIAADVRRVAGAVASRQDAIEQGITDVTALVAEARTAVAQAGPAIESFGQALRTITPERVERIVAGVDRITSGVAGVLPSVEVFVTDATSAAQGVARVADVIAARGDEIGAAISDGSALVARLREGADRVPGLVSSVEARVEEAGVVIRSVDAAAINEAVRDVGTVASALAAEAPNIGPLIENIGSASQSVDRIASGVATQLPQIEAIISDAAQTAQAVRAFAGGLPGLLDTVRPGVENVSAVLSAVDPDEVGALVRQLQEFSGALAAQSGRIDSIMASADGAAERIDAIASALAIRTPQLGAIVDEVEQTIRSAQDFAARLPGLVDAAQPGIENVSAVLSAIDPALVEEMVENAATFTEGLAAQSESIGTLIARANDVAGDAAEISASLAERTPQITATIDDVRAAAADGRAAIAEARAVVVEAAPAVRSLAEAAAVVTPTRVDDLLTQAQLIAGGLARQGPNIEAILTDARASAEAVRTIATELAERAPQIGTIVDDAGTIAGNVRMASESLPELVAAAEPGVRSASAALEALDPAAIGAIQQDVAAFAASVAAQRETIEALIGNAAGAAERVDAVASAIAQRTPQIGAVIDSVEATARSAQDVAARLPGLADALEPGLRSISEALSAVDPEAVRTLVDSASSFASALSAESARIGAILADAERAAGSAANVLETLDERRPQIGTAIDDATAAVGEARRFAASLPELTDALTPGVDNLAAVLTAIDEAAIRATIDNVESFTRALSAEAPRIGRIAEAAEVASTEAAVIATRLRGELDGIEAGINDARIALVEARRFAEGLPALLATIEPGVVNVSAVLQSVDPAAIEEIVENVRGVSQTLADARGEIDSVLSVAGQAARQVERVTRGVSSRVGEIEAAIDDAARFAASLGAIGPQVEGIAEQAGTVIDNIGATVSAVNTEAVNSIIENIQTAAAAVGSRAGEIGTAIDQAANAARGLSEGLGTLGGEDGTIREVLDQARRIGANLEAASSRVSLVVDRAGNILDGPAQRLVANVSMAAADISDVAGAFATRADSIAGGLSKFSRAGLDDLRALLNQGRTTLAAIEAAVSSFERNPSRVIFGGSDGPRYTPQRR